MRGQSPRMGRAIFRKVRRSRAYDAASPVADIKVDAPGSRPQPCLLLGERMKGVKH